MVKFTPRIKSYYRTMAARAALGPSGAMSGAWLEGRTWNYIHNDLLCLPDGGTGTGG
jgi:hypothetical protein